MQFSKLDQLTMPRILAGKVDGDIVSLDLAIDEQLWWFRGHFPDCPVLPGIVQLHWAVKIAGERFGVSVTPPEILRLKFKSIITPPMSINLILSRVAETEIQFQFSTTEQQYSLGRLRYAGSNQ
jgi:3-hydroxymyristoyl/3-hydroxydecanoyl-(acyl carrier protein) dehydratase